MAKNRKAAQDFILSCVEKMMPGSGNQDFYKDLFAKMSDQDFDKWIENLELGKEQLVILAPNMSEHKLSVERNLALAKELGHDFFQRVWLTSKDGKSKYLTPRKHLVVKLPIRRQAQLLVKKISIPQHNNTIDTLTGQPTGASKGGKISYPELQILSALGLDNSITEMIKLRGGDEKGFHAFNTFIQRQGVVSQKEIEPYTGAVKANETLHALLTAMHLENDL